MRLASLVTTDPDTLSDCGKYGDAVDFFADFVVEEELDGAELSELSGTEAGLEAYHSITSLIAICTGSRSKLNGPTTMLGGTGGTTVANVNSRPLPSLFHSLNQGHGAFATPGTATCCRIVSVGYFSVRSTQRKSFLLAR